MRVIVAPNSRRVGPLRRACLAACVALSICGTPTPAGASGLLAPDEAGRYAVGFTTFPSTIGADLPTKITVWYPHCRAVYAGCSSAPPGTPTYPVTIFGGPNPQFTIPTALGATPGVSVESGSFPLVLDLHGGPAGAPFRERSRMRDFELMEHLASHGFVGAAYERNNAGQCSNELAGPRDVISTLLARSRTAGDLLEGSIDPTRIGVTATSAGGDAAYSLLTGADPSPQLPQGIAPDERVKALLATEAVHSGCGITPERKASVTRPYLVMGGSPDRYDSNVVQPFREMVNASPRILVQTITKAEDANLNAEHLGFNVGDCDTTDTIREESLRLQQASGQNPLVEPLTSRFGSDPAILDSGARVLAAEARRQWNNAINLFIRQKTMCNRVGTDPSGILPIGVPSPDGLVTSSPPFESSPFVPSNPAFTACSPVRCITGERMDRLTKLFATSFWKAYLKGDRRYNRFLTHGYSHQEPDAIVTRTGDEGA